VLPVLAIQVCVHIAATWMQHHEHPSKLDGASLDRGLHQGVAQKQLRTQACKLRYHSTCALIVALRAVNGHQDRRL
jgi:hypothetical protein